MFATTPLLPSEPTRPSTPEGRGDRTGAIWVTAAGALLLLAAATTFVAVRWETLHDWQKFAALLVVTQLLIAGGWVGRRRVPATAAALFSLGVVLVPLDAWTIAAAGEGDWHRGLFAGGLLAVLAVPVARRWFDTTALRWAWVASVPVAVTGAAAWFGVIPPAVVVAALGLVALSSGRTRDGLAWLAVGAIAPLATLADPLLPIGRGVLADLGLVGAAIPWTTAATAVLLVAAMVINGTRVERSAMVAVGGALALADLAAALVVGEAGATGWWITAGALVLGFEIAASLGQDDAFWASPTRTVAVAGEVASVGAGVILLQLVLMGTFDGSWYVRPAVASLTATLFAVAWSLADHRTGRAAGRDRLADLLTGDASLGASFAVAAFASFALATLPVPLPVVSVAGVVLGGGYLLGRRSGGVVVGPVLAAIAPLVAVTHCRTGLIGMVLGTTVLAVGAARERDRAVAAVVSGVGAATLAVHALAYWAFDSELGTEPMSHWHLLLVAGVALGTGSLAGLRRSVLAIPAWAVALLTVAVSSVPVFDSPVRIAVPALVIVWLLAEAARRRELLPAVGAALAGPALSAALLDAAGYRPPQLGAGLAVVAIAVVGLALVTARAVRPAWFTAAAAHLLVGVAIASASPGPVGVIVLIAGLLAVAIAVVDRSVRLAYNGAGLALLGIWQALAGYDIGTAEAYLAPLALVLLLAGMHARSTRQLSSWIAYTPPIVVLGGASFALRVAGEPGWHGVVAGAVAVAAVAAGSWRRLAGPLFLGSALLAAVTVNETLTRSAGVPTWIWLALGGCALLGAGVTMEMRGLGPIESGRKVVQLVAERFE